MLDGTRVGQNLYQSFSSAQTDQDGLDAAANTPVQVAGNMFKSVGKLQLLFFNHLSQRSFMQNWYDEVSFFNSDNISPFV